MCQVMGTRDEARAEPHTASDRPQEASTIQPNDTLKLNGHASLAPEPDNNPPAKLRRNVSFTAHENDPIEAQVIEFCRYENEVHEKSDEDESQDSQQDVPFKVSKQQEEKDTDNGDERTSRVAPDGGWGWVILVATFFNYIIVAAIWHSFPVLYLEYSVYFHEGLAKIGVLASVEAASLHFVGAFGSGLVERYGSRPVAMVGSTVAAICVFSGAFTTSLNQLYCVYAFAGGGIGLSYVSFVVIVQQWFDKRRPIASGFSLTGFSVAVFCLPPLTRWLLDWYGWRGCLILMSGVYLNGIVMAALLRPVPVIKKPNPRPRTMSFTESFKRQVSVEKVQTVSAKLCRFCKQVFDFSMLSDARFVLYGLGTFFMMIGHIAFIAHIVSKAERYLGIEKHKAMMLPSIYGISNGICRMLFSVVASLPKVNRTVQYGVWIIVGGLICCLSCFAKDFTTLAICCSAFGMCVGSYISIQHPVLVDLLGIERIVRSAGLLQIFIGFAGLVATPFAGWLYDVSNNYDIPYFIIGALKILGGIVILIILCLPNPGLREGEPCVESEVPQDDHISVSSCHSDTPHRRRRTLSESSYTLYSP